MKKEKIVLDSCIVKDLIQYHKDKKPKYNNGIDIKAVYEYIINLQPDGVSKCYVTIYSMYEILKDFKEDFNENFFIFKTILNPQTITSAYARKFVNDIELVDLDEQNAIIQQKVMSDLRSLIVDLYSGIFGDIFIGVLLSLIGILEIKFPKNNSRLKMVKKNVEQIDTMIRIKFKNEIGEYLQKSKRQTILYLNKEYVRFMELVFGVINKLDDFSKVNYKTLNKSLILFINTLYSNKHSLPYNDRSNVFTLFFEWFKDYYSTNQAKKMSDMEILKELKGIIMPIIKHKLTETNNELNDERFYSTVEKLYFRDFNPKTTMKRDSTYGFGFDINDIIDTQILLICLKGKHFENEIPILTADKNMRELIHKYMPSANVWYKKFYNADKDIIREE